MNNYDKAVHIATWNDEGNNAAVCDIAKDVFILVCDGGELFILKNFRNNAKRVERTVTGDWAYKFLTRANGVTVRPYTI